MFGGLLTRVFLYLVYVLFDLYAAVLFFQLSEVHKACWQI